MVMNKAIGSLYFDLWSNGCATVSKMTKLKKAYLL